LAKLALASALKGGWLTPDALIIVEERANEQDLLPEGFHVIEERVYGLTKLVFAGLDRPNGTTEGPN
jgi:16S rRNA (guanine966-N2)-methyltransferase